MQRHAQLGPTSSRSALEGKAPGRAIITLLDHEEEDQYSDEEHAGCDLQCAESLAIAANRVGEDVFGLKRLLRGIGVFGGRRWP